ncbi:aldo/keto reductase [Isoptericola sp. BMS4]|uniref:aldo/keto reductase n=1 Tax=Isoptericola sp. BMS4 TaxID=2527875 RepID=UPI0014230973|nr:aldo/keto reductase [Isoptericola sp. BMS4]
MTVPDARTRLGTTGLRVPPVVLGTSALGRRVGAEDAHEVLRAAAAAGWHTWDTSNEYGQAEARIGTVLPGLDAPVQVFTKADPAPGGGFTGARVRASVAESLDRLGVDRLPLVHLHDPERITFDEATTPDGPWRALLDLREQGVIGHVGVAGGPVALLRRFVRTGEVEAVVTHNRFTLLDRSAEPLLDDCAERGVGVLNAAPFGGAALATDDGPVRRYHYREVDAVQHDAVLRIRAIAREAGVPVGALALRSSTRDPRVSATVVGASSTTQLRQVLGWAADDVPDVWAALDAARPGPSHWVGPHGR